MFITAEIGINANGDIETAKRLIDMAVRCGCDAVKFQKRTIDKVYSKEFLDSPRESPWGTTQREQKEALEFSLLEYEEINEYCQGKIDWYASAWDLESQEFLTLLNLKYNKLASKMLENTDLVDMVAQEKKYTFISTGLGYKPMVYAINKMKQYKTPFILMHCIMEYPCPALKCNLTQIVRLKEAFGCPVGYSSHHPKLLDKRLAVALGAEALEVHVTLDRAGYGTDQSASLEEYGLRLMVRDARMIGDML